MPVPVNVRNRDLVGGTVTLDHDVELGDGARFPAGTTCKVTGAPKTLTVRTLRCPCCGASHVIRGLRRDEISPAVDSV